MSNFNTNTKTSLKPQPTTPATEYKVDFAFLRKVEGFKTEAYIPEDKDGNVIGQSGVTIVSGLDLGQQSEQTLKAMGLTSEEIAVFRPYLGLKKDKAKAKLEETGGFTLPQKQAEQINTKVKKYYTKKVAAKYNEVSDTKFSDLTGPQQTVVTSVLFQYGFEKPEVKVKNFWSQVTSGQWDKALSNLRDFKDDYDTRRNSEADLLSGGSKPSGYSVSKGDTLTSIAKKNNTSVAKLKELNNLSSDMIQVGQQLKVK